MSASSILCAVLLCGVLVLLTGPVDDLLTARLAGLPQRSVLRCWDSLYHGCIGGLSWLLVLVLCPQLTVVCGWVQGGRGLLACNVAAAFLVSTAVDLDHVVPDLLARLQGKEGLPWKRGVLHYSLPVMVAAFLALTYSASQSHHNGYTTTTCITLLLLVAVLSHHIRDSVRHGLWLQPLLVTRPLSAVQYSVATVVLPLVVAAGGVLLLLGSRDQVLRVLRLPASNRTGDVLQRASLV